MKWKIQETQRNHHRHESKDRQNVKLSQMYNFIGQIQKFSHNVKYNEEEKDYA